MSTSIEQKLLLQEQIVNKIKKHEIVDLDELGLKGEDVEYVEDLRRNRFAVSLAEKNALTLFAKIKVNGKIENFFEPFFHEPMNYSQNFSERIALFRRVENISDALQEYFKQMNACNDEFTLENIKKAEKFRATRAEMKNNVINLFESSRFNQLKVPEKEVLLSQILKADGEIAAELFSRGFYKSSNELDLVANLNAGKLLEAGMKTSPEVMLATKSNAQGNKEYIVSTNKDLAKAITYGIEHLKSRIEKIKTCKSEEEVELLKKELNDYVKRFKHSAKQCATLISIKTVSFLDDHTDDELKRIDKFQQDNEGFFI